ncbi:PaaI family thioesterase [Bacillus sp. V33-4]|uniref:PaaI family thioesterase n=1 Tax=Bacillus sp. V33-4 TaxID=2054169 RepID=UPI000C784933|nr:PaaI family thioesterase [Bacillus sp. V33-4]PLR81242.1 esterase [Bacillus sp. V33-4]
MDNSVKILTTLGIEILEKSPDKVVATMPVHGPTRQPFGILHGGASVILAETVASLGTWECIDMEIQYGVGLGINANHLRRKKEGTVKAIATPIHKDECSVIWEINITDEEGELVCISKCTMAVVTKK